MSLKKIAKSVLLCSTIVLYTVSTFGATFKDVPTSHWAYTAVADMQKRGIMLTQSTGEFYPNNKMNYFDAADALAKATGYVDVNVNQNVNAAFKQQILNNYEAQKSTLAAYEKKYKSWDKLYNQQIAYLLGRGYLKKDELDRFVTVGQDKKEVKSSITKQELAIFIVRFLGKEETAKTNYKVSGFSDDSAVAEAYKPYVGYLKAVGLVSADAKGAFNPSTPVTRATCAQLLSNAFKLKEKGTASPQGSNTQTGTSETVSSIVTIKKVVPKNQTEYYILLEKGVNTSFFTIKTSTKVTDSSGTEVAIATIPLETKATITTALENNTEYITSMKLQTSSGDGVQTSGTVVMIGTVARIGINGDLSVLLPDNTTKTYLVDPNCVVVVQGAIGALTDVNIDSRVRATVMTNAIVKIEVLSEAADASVSSLNSGEIIAKTVKTGGYELTVKQGSRTSKLTTKDDVIIRRNNKRASFEDIKIGDKVEIVRNGGEITELLFTGTRVSVEGQIKSVCISAEPEITLITKNGTETFIIGAAADLYDNNERENVTIRDLRLGQNVELLLESKEVISLVIQRNTGSSAIYKGVIQSIGKKSDYIDVIVDYDPATGKSKVLKRIYTPTEVQVEMSGRREHRSLFTEGMNIVATYKYLDDTYPEKILIIE